VNILLLLFLLSFYDRILEFKSIHLIIIYVAVIGRDYKNHEGIAIGCRDNYVSD
jgi:hypothetical protein